MTNPMKRCSEENIESQSKRPRIDPIVPTLATVRETIHLKLGAEFYSGPLTPTQFRESLQQSNVSSDEQEVIARYYSQRHKEIKKMASMEYNRIMGNLYHRWMTHNKSVPYSYSQNPDEAALAYWYHSGGKENSGLKKKHKALVDPLRAYKDYLHRHGIRPGDNARGGHGELRLAVFGFELKEQYRKGLLSMERIKEIRKLMGEQWLDD